MIDFAERLQSNFHTAARVAIDLDLFSLVNAPMTADEIAEKTGTDCILIGSCQRTSTMTGTPGLVQLMRTRSAFQFFDEVREGCDKATKRSRALAIPNLRDWVKIG